MLRRSAISPAIAVAAGVAVALWLFATSRAGRGAEVADVKPAALPPPPVLAARPVEPMTPPAMSDEAAAGSEPGEGTEPEVAETGPSAA